MSRPCRRRLQSLASHVTRRGGESDPRRSPASADAAGSGCGGAPPPLGEPAIKAFLSNGFLAFPVDDLPPGFHEDFYGRACELKAAQDLDFGSSAPRQQFGSELAAQSDAILSSAKTRGALESLLGPDFAGGGGWDDGVLAANDRDQGFHKDNGHEPTRDWSPRQISLFYYPGPCTDNDGPTVFLPGTQYFALDREGLGHGEERLDASMIAPKTAEEWRLATPAYCDTRSADEEKNPSTTFEELDRNRAEGIPLLGVDGLRERRMTHRGGYVVLWHNNLFHRRARQRLRGSAGGVGKGPELADFSDVSQFGDASSSEVNFRPVVRFGFFRTSEPTASQWQKQTRGGGGGGDGDEWPGVEGAAEVLWRPQLEWLSGGTAAAGEPLTSQPAAALLDQKIKELHQGGERARTCAAVTLGRSGDAAAIAELAAALRGGAEAQRRAACYGMAHGGIAAVPALLELLRQPPTAVYQTDKLLFALGRAMAQQPPLPCPSATDDDGGGVTLNLLRDCVTAVGSVMDTASAKLDALLSAQSVEALHELETAATRGNRGYDGRVYAGEVPPNAEADDARGNLAEAVRTLGLLGSLLMRRFLSGAVEVEPAAAALREVVARLTPCILQPDRASCFPSRFPHTIRISNAAQALLELCSTTTSTEGDGCFCPPAILPSTGVHPEYAQLVQDAELAGRAAAGDVASGNLVRLALARLAWRRTTRGWTAGHEVVSQVCAGVPQWAGLLQAAALVGPI